MPRRLRLDAELVRRGLARSREHASELIAAKRVKVSGALATKPATGVTTDVALVVLDDPDHPDYVSRGGHKLAGALSAFEALGLVVEGRRCLDAGASTGGFTDVLLRHGAAEVVAVDVGYGQMAWSLRQDPRVQVHDRTNVRELTTDQIGDLSTDQVGALTAPGWSWIGSRAMKALRSFTVRPSLPPGLAALEELAMNLRWSWDSQTRDLFRWVDPDGWDATVHDPVRLLGLVGLLFATRVQAVAFLPAIVAAPFLVALLGRDIDDNCIRCNVQIHGSGARPEDVILDGASDPEDPGVTGTMGAARGASSEDLRAPRPEIGGE